MTRDELERWLAEQVALKTGMRPADVSADAAFNDFNLESIDAIEISGALEELLSRPIEPTILYDFPTIGRLAGHLAAAPAAGRDPQRGVSAGGEPVAIVGIGCRFPGARGPQAFWRLLLEGKHAITEVPADRWDGRGHFDPDRLAPGKMTTRWGGFLEDVDGFDHRFFGISLEEAAAMDPQQRALLEVTWEALEDAGVPPSTLAGSDTGVFLGISHNDFERSQLSDPRSVGGHTGVGNALSVAANRISYKLDLHGPSLAVDTACSSSLVATHLALQSLRQGECGMALVAGVNVMLSPEITIAFSKAGMMAPDGLCKTFGRDADGYVRGEGVGVLVLSPLSAAEKTGRRIYAVISGSAINQDGRTNGLNAPSGAAQEAVLRAAYRAANVRPATVAFVEAHGTGTRLGDAIEAAALGRVVGAGRPAQSPCLVGSVKTNIGHLESAAGAAGLIKTALALSHRIIPASLHADEPNPDLGLHRIGLRVAASPQPIEGEPKAGVSAFGFGGSNCHVVLEGAPATARRPQAGPHLFALSAKTPQALARMADDVAAFAAAAGPGADAYDVAAELARGRDHHPVRLAVACDSLDELAPLLRRETPQAGGSAGRLGFVFPGQGAQYAGMARDLASRFPAFAASIERSSLLCAEWLGASLLDIVDRSDLLEQTRFAQPALIAVQIALLDLLGSLDVRADMFVGHSVGEIAAAFAAGALDRGSALRLACERGRALETPLASGAMLAVKTDPERLAQLIAPETALSIAAYNGPDSAVVSGPSVEVRAFAERLRGLGVACRLLPVRYAFHTLALAPAAQAFADGLDWLSATQPQRPLFSTVTGERLREAPDAAHWGLGAPRPVLFANAIEAMASEGLDLLIEIAPREVLAPSLGWVRAAGARVDSLALVRQDSPGRSVLRALGELYRRNRPISLQALFPQPAARTGLPTYAWDRSANLRARRLAQQTAPSNPTLEVGSLLGRRLTPLHDTPIHLWRCEITHQAFAWLFDHDVAGGAVLPAAAAIEMMTHAARLGGHGAGLEDFAVTAPVRLVRGQTTTVVVKVQSAGSVGSVELSAKGEGAADWVVCATARVSIADVNPSRPAAAPTGFEPVEPSRLYEDLRSLGLRYGAAFRAIAALQRGPDEAFGELEVDQAGLDEEARRIVALDCAFQAIAAAAPAAAQSAAIWTPHGASRVTAGPGGSPRFVRAKLAPVAPEGERIADVVVLGADHQVVLAVDGVRLSGRSTRRSDVSSCWLYDDRWLPLEFEATAGPGGGRWVLLAGQDVAAANQLAAALEARGDHVEVVSMPAAADGPRLEHAGRILDALSGPTSDRLGVVCLWPLDELAVAPHDQDCVPKAADDIRELLRLSARLVEAGRLWLVTAGAQDVGADQVVVRPRQSPIWGLGYAAAFELPQLRCARLDIDPVPAAAHWPLIARLLGSGTAEDQFAVRGTDCFVRRIVERPPPTAAAHEAKAGAYLITGGFGALGLQLARSLVARGARRLILVGRRGPDDEARAILASLESQGATIVQVLADVGEAAAFETVVRQAKATPGGVRGIFHAAGVLRDAPVMTIEPADLERVMRAKVRGAWALHQLSLECGCEVFCLFSSAAAALGSIGQGAYMAANAYLQGLAAARRRAGLPATCIDWGPWARAGMAAEALQAGRGASVAGVAGIDPNEGVETMLRLVAEGATRTVVLPYDLRDLIHLYPAKSGLALFDQLRGGDARHPASRADDAPAPRPSLSEPFVAPRTPLELLIAGIWQRALGLEAVGARDPFFELGGDSVFASQILLQIERRLDVSLSTEEAFADLTVQRLSLLAEAAILDRVELMAPSDVTRSFGELRPAVSEEAEICDAAV